MDLVVVGLNHKLAPVSVRERIAFRPEQMPAALGRARAATGCAEAAILSTCNRVELYLAGFPSPVSGFQFQAAPPETPRPETENRKPETAEGVRDRAVRFLAEFHGLDAASFQGFLYVHEGAEAVRHLFEVAGSLDSMVVGETQILSQVKEAYAAAQEAGSTGRRLHALFPRAFAAAKRIHSETSIGSRRVSVPSVAAEFAEKIFSDLSTKTILLLGAGETGRLTLESFLDLGVRDPVLCNRTFEKARELAARHGGTAIPFEELRARLPKTDVVISTLAAEGYVLGPEAVREALRERGHQPILFIDIAVPRNIDPAVNAVDNAFVYDIDDLERVVRENREERGREVDRCRPIVAAEVEAFLVEARGRDLGPVVAAFRQAVHEAARAELSRTLSRMPDLAEDRRREIEAAMERIVNRILHRPTQALRDGRLNGVRDEVLDALRRIFEE